MAAQKTSKPAAKPGTAKRKSKSDQAYDAYMSNILTLPSASKVMHGEDTVWLDVELIDDSPFQTRGGIDPTDVDEMATSLNESGQLQAAIVRPHPTEPDRYQQAFAHTRKAAIKAGANAGSHLENPDLYKGKLWCVIREQLTDVQMMQMAIAENDTRSDVSDLERARSFNRLREMLPRKAGKPAPLEAVAKVAGIGYRQVKRLVDLLELPEEIQKQFVRPQKKADDQKDDFFLLNERHGRALLQFQEDPKRQRVFFREIVRHQWSGAEAERKAQAERAQRALPSDIIAAKEQENKAWQELKQRNRETVAKGEAPFKVLPGGETPLDPEVERELELAEIENLDEAAIKKMLLDTMTPEEIAARRKELQKVTQGQIEPEPKSELEQAREVLSDVVAKLEGLSITKKERKAIKYHLGFLQRQADELTAQLQRIDKEVS
jgi:ParB/RepB/Spo0J family partition protein